LSLKKNYAKTIKSLNGVISSRIILPFSNTIVRNGNMCATKSLVQTPLFHFLSLRLLPFLGLSLKNIYKHHKYIENFSTIFKYHCQKLQHVHCKIACVNTSFQIYFILVCSKKIYAKTFKSLSDVISSRIILPFSNTIARNGDMCAA
jgi:hypothetical protein